MPFTFVPKTTIITPVAYSASAVTLLAANVNRLGFSVFNDSASYSLFLKMGAGATSASFSVILIPQAYFEGPFWYAGIVTGIWDSLQFVRAPLAPTPSEFAYVTECS